MIRFLSAEEDVDDSEDESLGSHRASGCCFARGCGLRDLDGDSARQIPMGRMNHHDGTHDDMKLILETIMTASFQDVKVEGRMFLTDCLSS